MNTYPFSAVAGLEDLKLALLINAVSPPVGGVLVRGEKVKGSFALVRTAEAKNWLLIKHKDRFVAKTDLTAPVAIMIGNEGRGLTAEQLAYADARATIPCPGAGSLKCPASPTSTQPGPEGSRKNPSQRRIPKYLPTRRAPDRTAATGSLLRAYSMKL